MDNARYYAAWGGWPHAEEALVEPPSMRYPIGMLTFSLAVPADHTDAEGGTGP